MKSYEYNSIFTPQEFQDFARDIIQIKENKFIESFAEGKDGGIDGRFIDQEGNITILQVKRYKNIFLNPYPDYVVLILMTLYAVTFVLFVNKQTVIIKAFDYAKSLIEVCERI